MKRGGNNKNGPSGEGSISETQSQTSWRSSYDRNYFGKEYNLSF